MNLKVLLVVHYFFPDHFYGTETYTLEVARDLRRRGYEVEILSAMSPGEAGGKGTLLFQYKYDDFIVHCVDYNHAPHTTFRQLYYRPEMYSFYCELLSEIAPDIMHVTHLMNHTAVILEAAESCAVPVMATLTDFFGICFNSRLSDVNEQLCSGPNSSGSNCLRCYMEAVGSEELAGSFGRLRPLAENRLFRTLAAPVLARLGKLPFGQDSGSLARVRALTERTSHLHNLYQKYQKMVAPTDFLYDAYVANHFSAAKMVKINFGINWDVVADFRTMRKYDPERPLRFGYIGQLADHKGVDMLVRAFKAVKGRKELHLYGSPGPGAPYYEELVRLADGDRSISFAGTFPETELGQRLSEIDVLVIPSRWHENSPLVMLYALATRTPMIVSAVKGMTEFVKNGENGLTFERGNLDDLIQVMRRIMENPFVIEEFSRSADYGRTISGHVDELVEIYQKLS